MKNFVEELQWRGMIHDIMPGLEEHLLEKKRVAYVGIDPTADSLHIGHLVSIMMLKHFQLCGHKPIVLLGGATGMVGDPSGKSLERNLLSKKVIFQNQSALESQISKFLDFDNNDNSAEVVNNYTWMESFSFLDFIREVGKNIPVNYMMAKDSVKKRLSGEHEGMSFTEFTYQLIQGYDFNHLYNNFNCTLQMGGSDQWGNITTGSELIRRRENGKAFALTCPLITKSDGVKFGKTEEGNIWLDPNRTSPFKFYQYWLNVSDEDAEKFIKIFTLLSKEEVSIAIEKHNESKHLRYLQKLLAAEITQMVHGVDNLKIAMDATDLLFNSSSDISLSSLDESTFMEVFSGIPQNNIDRKELDNGIDIVSVLSLFLGSRNECRRALSDNSVSVNRIKVDDSHVINGGDLINNKYLLLQRGKKKYFLLSVID